MRLKLLLPLVLLVATATAEANELDIINQVVLADARANNRLGEMRSVKHYLGILGVPIPVHIKQVVDLAEWHADEALEHMRRHRWGQALYHFDMAFTQATSAKLMLDQLVPEGGW